MSVLVLFLVIEDYVIGSRFRAFLIEREIEHTRFEVDLMGAAALESLLKHDYVSVTNLLERLGQEHVHIVSINATAPNGFNLAGYQRPGEAPSETYVVKLPVTFDGETLIFLEVLCDLVKVEDIVDEVTYGLVSASVIFMFCLGVLLWYSQKKMAIMPLEKEIVRREEAERGLEEARSTLERRVDERTAALSRELVERKKAEETVRERQKEIRLLLDSTAEAIYGLDVNGSCTFCNPSCIKLLGYEDENELLGRNMHGLVHHTHPDGTPYPEDQCRVCDAFREVKGIHVEEEVLWRADGTSFPVEYWAHPIIKDGQVAGAVVTFLDITKRKQAETEKQDLLATLNTLVEHMPEGVFLLNESSTVVMANPVGKEYLKSVAQARVGDRLDTLAGSPVGQLLVSPPQILWHDLEADGRVYQAGGRSLAGGGVVFVMRDVTRDRELDKRLRLQERMAAVGQLAAGIAHDFNNILTVINGYAEMLKGEETLDAETRRALDAIYQSGEKGAELIHQILDFSRQTVGEMKPLNIGEFIDEFFEFIKRIIPENIEVRIVPGRPGLMAEGDPSKLQQMIANLVVNARDAMPDGGILTIRASERDYKEADQKPPIMELAGYHWAVIEVMDTGSGIPDKVLPHIFEPFYTTKGPGHGTGLGLPQVYGLIKQHGGHVNVKTSADGTNFEVFLPITINGHEKDEAEDEVVVTEGMGQVVLVVEDEEAVRKLITNVLKSLGYVSITAENGREALEIFQSTGQHVALVITDIIMPEMDGMRLSRELKKDNPDLPIIAISGYTVGYSDEEIVEAGIAEMIKKPFRVRDLAEAVSRHLPGPEAAKADSGE